MSGQAGPEYPGSSDGLVFCFDPKNPICIPEFGTDPPMHDMVNNMSITPNGFSNDEFAGILTPAGYLTVDGTDDYMSLPSAPGDTGSFALQEFTVSCWLEPVYPSTGGGANNYIFYNLSGGETNGWTLMISLQPLLRVWDTEGIKEARAPAYNGTQWYNWVGVKGATGLSNNLIFYENGAQYQSSPATCVDVDYTSATYTPFIGANTIAQKEMEGKLGPLMIWNRALSADEVLANYNRLKGRFGL